MKILSLDKINFNGLIVLSGPNKNKDIVVNTDNISTISSRSFFDKKEDSPVGVGFHDGSMLTMNNKQTISIFLPNETIIDAYKKAQGSDITKLETKYDSIAYTPIC